MCKFGNIKWKRFNREWQSFGGQRNTGTRVVLAGSSSDRPYIHMSVHCERRSRQPLRVKHTFTVLHTKLKLLHKTIPYYNLSDTTGILRPKFP